MVSKKNKTRKFETFRLEDRVLFEAAAAAEIVEASENVAEAQNEDKNQNQDKEESFADVHVDAGLDVDEESDFSGSSLPLLPEDLDDADNMYESLLDGEIPDHSDMDDMVLNSFVEDIVSDWIDVNDGLDLDHGSDLDYDGLDLNHGGDLDYDGSGLSDFLEIHDSDMSLTVHGNRELVIINSSVPDAESFLTDQHHSNRDYLMLERGTDAFEIINDYLDECDTKYSAIHIVSHGEDGGFWLNGEKVNSDSLDVSEWESIGQHITDDGDILLYGCDIAQTDYGRSFLQQIADASGADIAASIDTTGLYGNWDLEYTIGNVEAMAISMDSTYVFDLAPITIEVNEIGDLEWDNGTYTLREALIHAGEVAHNYDEITIIFDADVFDTEANRIISINKELILNDALSDVKLIVNGDVNDERIFIQTINLYHNIFKTDEIEGTSGDWDLSFSNLELQGGVGAENGGVFFIEGNDISLSLDNVFVKETEVLYNGGAVYAVGTDSVSIFLHDSILKDNKATLGSAIYSYSENGLSKVEVENSLIINNQAITTIDYSVGAGIYSKGLDSEVNVVNSTIVGNSANTAGAIYSQSTRIDNGFSRVNVISSTIAGNTDNITSGGIYAHATSSTSEVTVSLVNSIVYGNYTGNKSSDIVFGEDSTNTLNVAYSIYGTSNADPSQDSIDVSQFSTTKTNIHNIFANDSVIDEMERWLPKIADTGSVNIRKGGEAAIHGTLTGKLGNDYYFFNMSNGQWMSYSNDYTVAFNENDAVSFGLAKDGQASFIYKEDQFGHDRVHAETGYKYFNVGATSLTGTFDAPTITYEDGNAFVWVDLDGSIDITDGRTTLREALVYLANLNLEDGKTYTIRFAEAFFPISTSSTVTLTNSRGSDGELVLSNGLAGKKVVIDAGKNQNDLDQTVIIQVENVGRKRVGETEVWEDQTNADPFRVFRVGATYDTWSDWDVSLTGIILHGGAVSADHEGGAGGAMYVHGANVALSFTRSVIQGSLAQHHGGGLYVLAENISNLAFDNTTVIGNKGGDGGGIYHRAKQATITLNDSSILSNTSSSFGGGVYNYSTNGDAVLSLAGTNVLLNSANLDGGGIYNVSDTGASRITLNSTINNADENYLIKHSIVSGNISQEGSGAGIYSRGLTSNLNIKDSWIYSNATYGTESSGGGIYSTAVSSSVVTVENSNIFKNVTSGFNDYGAGSAIYSYSENNEGLVNP